MQFNSMKKLLCILFLFFSLASADAQLGTLPYSGAQVLQGWSTQPIGGGGFVTNINIACDQGLTSCNNSGTATRVSRNDTYGAHYFNPNVSCGNTPLPGGCWQQIVTANSMPTASVTAATSNAGGTGSYEIVVAPSNTQHFYMLYGDGNLYTSLNRGVSWSLCAGWTQITASAGDGSRGMGNFMAVDPANENNLIVGTPAGGIFISSNGCSTMTHNATVPNSSAASGGYGNSLVAFDQSTISGGSTPRACATSYSNGIWCSSSGGGGITGTWTELNSTGMPTTFWHMIIDPNGIIYVCDNSSTAGGGNLNEYTGGAWSKPGSGTIGTDCESVAVDPNNTNHVYVMSRNNPGTLYGTTTGPGGTWFGHTTSPSTRTATDIPYLAFTNENFMTPSNIAFDPAGSNLLWFTEGVGIWQANAPTTGSVTINWTSFTAAIEELDMTQIISPPGGTIVAFAQDRPEFYLNSLTQYPSTHGLANPQANAIIYGYSGDWAQSSPSTIVGMGTEPFGSFTDESGISTNGGQTFTAFASIPTTPSSNRGGCIAATTPSAILWAPTNVTTPFVTANGGTSWSQPATLPSTGWTNQQQFNGNCAADRVTANTFYLYNYSYNGSFVNAVYSSSNAGSTWTQVCTPCGPGGTANFKNNGADINGAFEVQLQAMPSTAGNLFFTSGRNVSVSHPTSSPTPFYHSTNGGSTWAAIANFNDVWAFGFGAPKSGSSFSTIYAWGWYSGTLGTWRSTDNAATWTQLDNGYPLGIFAPIVTITGDNNNYGRVYECFQGGCVRGQFNFLLERDIDPASNDNDPAWLEKVA